MNTVQDLIDNAPLDVKAAVFEHFETDREAAYRVVENYCFLHDIFTDGSITAVLVGIKDHIDNVTYSNP
jgi:hypothetical protein